MARERLIALRRARVMTQEDVAHETGLDRTTISRIERGLQIPGVTACRALAHAYDVSFEELWDTIDGDSVRLNGHEVPSWLNHLASLEQGAGETCGYEPLVIHGLLQTEEYAKAVERVGGFSDTEVCERVRLRMARQNVLHRQPDPLRLWVVLDESTLLRRVGSDQVMAAQLDHLVEMAELPNVIAHVLPLTAEASLVAFGAFKLVTRRGEEVPFMAITEDGGGANYLDRQPEVRRHATLFLRLAELALSPSDSIELIRRVAKERYQ